MSSDIPREKIKLSKPDLTPSFLKKQSDENLTLKELWMQKPTDKEVSKTLRSSVKNSEKKTLTAPPKTYPLKRTSTKTPSFKNPPPQKLMRQYTMANKKKKKGYIEDEELSSDSDKDISPKDSNKLEIYEALMKKLHNSPLKVNKGGESSTTITANSFILTLKNKTSALTTPNINGTKINKIRSNSIIESMIKHLVGKNDSNDQKKSFHKQMSMRFPSPNPNKIAENTPKPRRSLFGLFRNSKINEIHPEPQSDILNSKNLGKNLAKSSFKMSRENHEETLSPMPLERTLSIHLKESEIQIKNKNNQEIQMKSKNSQETQMKNKEKEPQINSKKDENLELNASSALNQHLEQMAEMSDLNSPHISPSPRNSKSKNIDKKDRNSSEKFGIPNDFTLEDFMTLKKEIESEKKILEEEIKNVTQNKYTNVEMKLKGKFVEKWSRAKWNIKAAARMRRLNDDIKCYGSTFNISGIQQKMAKLESLFVRQKTLTQKLSHSWVFLPNSPIKSYWSYVVIFLLIYTSYITPYRVVFVDSSSVYDAWFFVETSIDVLFFFDILITLNSAYVDEKGTLVTNRCKIIFSYLKTWLILDILGIFPFYLIEKFMSDSNNASTLSFGDNYNDILKFLRLPRLYRIIRIARLVKFIKKAKDLKLIQYLQDFFQLNAGSVKIMIFLFTITICVHIMGCLWFFVAKIRDLGPDTWVAKLNL